MKNIISKINRRDALTLTVLLGIFAFFFIMLKTGAASNQFKNMIIPMSYYILLAISLNLMVGVLGELLRQLLNPVFAAAIHAGSDGFPDGIGAVHFGGGTQLNFGRVPTGGNGGGVDLFADGGNVTGNGHGSFLCLLFRFCGYVKDLNCSSWAVSSANLCTKATGMLRRLCNAHYGVRAAAFRGLTVARVEMACL
jgi:hypothetical protein